MTNFLVLATVMLSSFGTGMWWAHKNWQTIDEWTEGETHLYFSLTMAGSGLLAVISFYLQFSEAESLGLFIGLIPIAVMCFVFGILKYNDGLPDPETVEVPKAVAEQLLKKEDQKDPTIPEDLRFMHTLVVGGTGAGKTTLLSEWILEDIRKPCSVIVFDSQGDLVQRIVRLDIPRERVVLIDVEDIEYPPALSLFDIGRKEHETRYDRERHEARTVELISYILDFIGASLTSKQDTTLKFLIRLCLEIDGATVNTLRHLLTHGVGDYATEIDRLSPTIRDFFQREYSSKQYSETREQILRRVYAILSHDTLERMFSAPRSRLNMREILDSGSVVLINTAKEFLREEGSAFFTRFMTALIFQAVQERDPLKNNMPTFMYIDEAKPIMVNGGDLITTILETSRKYSFGLTLAFQELSKLSHDEQQCLLVNTNTKALSVLSPADARLLDRSYSGQRRVFSVEVKDHPVPHRRIEVTPKHLDMFPKRKDLKELIAENRARYSGIPTVRKEEPADDIESFNKA